MQKVLFPVSCPFPDMPIRLSLEGSLPSMTLLDYRMLQMQEKKTYQSVNSKRGWNLLYLIREKSTPPMSSCCYKSIVPPILIQIMFSNTRYHLPVQYKRGCNYYCSLSWPQNLIKKSLGKGVCCLLFHLRWEIGELSMTLIQSYVFMKTLQRPVSLNTAGIKKAHLKAVLFGLFLRPCC